MMMTIVLHLDAPSGQEAGIKEDIAMRLEPLGGVRVVSIIVDTPEQLHVAGYRTAQGTAKRGGRPGHG